MVTTVTRARHGRTSGVGFDLRGALEVRRDLGLLADRLPWLQERGIRTLARRLPVEARRDIQAEYNIRAGRVRDHLRGYTYSEGSARMAGVRLVAQWKRGIGLHQFSARATRRGVTYSVYRGAGRKLVTDAFIATLRGGNEHVLQRYGKKTWRRTYIDRKGQQRTRMDQPIEVLYRSTVAQMLAKGRRPERLLDYSRNLLQQEVERHLQSYLRRPGPS